MLTTPVAGGRILLELEGTDPRATSARYRVTLFEAAREHVSAAVLDAASGECVLEEFGSDAPAWMVEAARAFLRSTLKARRDEPDEPWPRRLLRWRAPKE